MDSDFKPARRPGKSLQAKLDASPRTPKTDYARTFKTPGEVAAADDVADPSGPAGQASTAAVPGGKSSMSGTQALKSPAKGWRKKLALHWPPGRKEWLVAAAVLLLLGLGCALLLTRHPAEKPVAVQHHAKKIVKPAPPKTVASTLTGLQVDPSFNLRPVTGVMIENSIDSRPQSGLSQAGVVFEAIAEGGITRFLALFQDTAPGDVGPIRSARPYYVQWNLGFDAGYAHVGGSPEALVDIKTWGVRDLDQFANSGSYHRITVRAAPHNVYTAIATLNQLEAAKGYTSSTFTGFLRKKEAPSKLPTAKSINLTLSGPLYNVHYDYIAATNSYNRSEGGAPHIDNNGNAQISPKVIIALIMPYGLEADDHHSQYGTIGSGPVFIFQDGTVQTGQWTKTTEKSQFIFTDAAGKPLPLNPGQTWLTALGKTTNVTYSP